MTHHYDSSLCEVNGRRAEFSHVPCPVQRNLSHEVLSVQPFEIFENKNKVFKVRIYLDVVCCGAQQ